MKTACEYTRGTGNGATRTPPALTGTQEMTWQAEAIRGRIRDAVTDSLAAGWDLIGDIRLAEFWLRHANDDPADLLARAARAARSINKYVRI
jgi:hypothetical protein